MTQEKVIVNPVEILNRITLANEEPEVREALRAMMDSYFLNGDFTKEQRIDTYLVFQDLDILIQEIFEWKRTFNTAENRN